MLLKTSLRATILVTVIALSQLYALPPPTIQRSQFGIHREDVPTLFVDAEKGHYRFSEIHGVPYSPWINGPDRQLSELNRHLQEWSKTLEFQIRRTQDRRSADFVWILGYINAKHAWVLYSRELDDLVAWKSAFRLSNTAKDVLFAITGINRGLQLASDHEMLQESRILWKWAKQYPIEWKDVPKLHNKPKRARFVVMNTSRKVTFLISSPPPHTTLLPNGHSSLEVTSTGGENNEVTFSVVASRDEVRGQFPQLHAFIVRVEGESPPKIDRRTDAALDCAERTLTSDFYTILKSGFPASPERGESGDGVAIAGLTLRTSRDRGESLGLTSFRRGEMLTIGDIELFPDPSVGSPESLHVNLISILRHNVTRGRGAFEHESPERLVSVLAVPVEMSCDVFQKIWSDYFAPTTAPEVEDWLEKYPAGVLVDELREGMSREEVEAMIGPPERRATLSGKVIYFYSNMKITFVNGKLVDIQ